MLKRRDAIKRMVAIAAGAYATPAIASPDDAIRQCGALMPVRKVRGPRFRDHYPVKGIARQLARERKNVFLYQNLQREIGEIEPHTQSSAPDGTRGEGDCVGHASAMGCDVLAATDIHLRGEPERWVAKASVESIYWGSRNEAGGGDIEGRAGSRGEWAARWLRDWGVLHRLVYDTPEGPIDLTGYDPGRSRERRDEGVPDVLEPIAKIHPVQMATLITSGEEALDAVCAGHPVILCSSYAFHDTRDAQGFAEPYRSFYRKSWLKWIEFRVQWWHAMILTGALLVGGRVGGLIQNSHGDWIDGPAPYDAPVGSFFADVDVIDTMAKDWGDCWALGSYHGHQTRRMKLHKLWR